MKKLKKMDIIKLEDYNVKVNRYLTYAQIQQIVDAVKKFDTWAERNRNIDMLILFHTTDIGTEKLEEVGHDRLIESGLIDAVKENIVNCNKVYEALDYTESIQRSLTHIVGELSKQMEQVKDVAKDGKYRTK